ncbi:Sucrose-binding protein [Camellia lanceoleosa]|uniref:Sucrose-binding protein n=1 Tax=Camellia lanceoleosa TaxID=1840588 RepID=A0ACC0IKH9_9ERIC|nr:Sucrose-binding protein [Camellia lanceoleosa]
MSNASCCSHLPLNDLSFRISVFQQIPGTLLVRGYLQHKESPAADLILLFKLLLQSLHESNREDDGKDSSEESMNDEEEDDDYDGFLMRPKTMLRIDGNSRETATAMLAYFGPGGENPELYFSAVSSSLLKVALNTKRDKIQRLFGQSEGIIIKASEEQIKATTHREEGGGIWPFGGESKHTFNLFSKHPSQSNQYGQFSLIYIYPFL